MANTAWIIVEIEISTDRSTPLGVDKDFNLYIVPALEAGAGVHAVSRVRTLGCTEIHDERGKIIAQAKVT